MAYRFFLENLMMRPVIKPQLQFGQVDISKMQFCSKSRDDIPQILRGLQYIYITKPLREEIFALLEKYIAPQVSKNTGRPGMELWKILVMGVLRLDLNWDYDHLLCQVNHYDQIREMLGHSDAFDKHEYQLQTLKDNVSLLTPELLEKINEVVVKGGHDLVKKKEDEVLRGRCDSFVVETNVHYPTDINLLFDAMRKVVALTAYLCERHKRTEWRQHKHHTRELKQCMRRVQQSRRRKKTNEVAEAKQERKITRAYREYLSLAQSLLNKAQATYPELENLATATTDLVTLEQITIFMNHAVRQMNQTERRVLKGEEIPHEEKVFSLFEPHTEWISKGKAGVPQELGLRVCILEDQYQFILHHRVMEKETDDAVAIPMIEISQKKFPTLKSVSFDKGFHSKNNQTELSKQLDLLAMPRKGKLSEAAKQHEHAEGFRKARKKHSAVESAIHALEVHGLDRCPDRGIDGFKRYVALAVVARNIQRIGAILQKQAQRKLLKEKNKAKKYCASDGTFKLAA